MSHLRTIGLLVALAITLWLPNTATAEPCSRHGAKELAADAKRATQWNWGWGGIYAASALGSVGLALAADNEDRELAMWVGVVKSSIGVGYQIVNPIQIERPEADCYGLDSQLAAAAEIERKRHGWFPHAGTLAVNLAAFVYVGYETDNYLLSARFALVGIAAGELAIYTSPDKVRKAGLGGGRFKLLPLVDADSQGLVLAGVF